MCDIGTISGNTFDIDSVAETGSLLVRSDTGGVLKNRFIYRDESGSLVIHERQKNVGVGTLAKGTLLKLSEIPGHAVQVDVEHTQVTNDVVGRLLIDVDWSDLSKYFSKTITVGETTYDAVLVPVKLQ